MLWLLYWRLMCCEQDWKGCPWYALGWFPAFSTQCCTWQSPGQHVIPSNQLYSNSERLSCCKSWAKVCMELPSSLPPSEFQSKSNHSRMVSAKAATLRLFQTTCSVSGESTAECTPVSRCFKPCRGEWGLVCQSPTEWGQRFVIKREGTQDVKQRAHHTIQETSPLKLLLQGHSFHQYKREAQERWYYASRHSIWNMLYCLCKYCWNLCKGTMGWQ